MKTSTLQFGLARSGFCRFYKGNVGGWHSPEETLRTANDPPDHCGAQDELRLAARTWAEREVSQPLSQCVHFFCDLHQKPISPEYRASIMLCFRSVVSSLVLGRVLFFWSCCSNLLLVQLHDATRAIANEISGDHSEATVASGEVNKPTRICSTESLQFGALLCCSK